MILEFDRAFIDRPTDRHLPDETLRRLQVAYRRAKADPRGLRSVYRVGNEWSPIYEQYMSDFISALQDDSTAALRDLLENFFRRDFSNGLHGLHFEMVERYMTPGRPIQPQDLQAYAQTVAADMDRLFKSVPDLDVSRIQAPQVGNPYGYEIDGRFHCGLHFFYFANKIDMLVAQQQPRIVELGAGYGGLPWAIKTCMPGARYLDMDLPEVLAIAAFYILSAFPQANVALFGEVDASSAEDLDRYDFVFLPNFEIERLPADWADLAFNSWSLAEMEPGPIANYVGHLGRVASRYFFHVNHAVYCKVSADLFPVDAGKFRLLHRAPAMWGKSEHRNNMICEHEYVYTRRLTVQAPTSLTVSPPNADVAA
jgi:putative sugar O-methyltransferase